MNNFKKRLLKHSQNFLYNQKLVEFLVEKSSIAAGDTVYEIGPGKGIITAHLAKKAWRVLAVEKDKLLYDELLNKFEGIKNTEIISGDFLNFQLPKKGDYKIFSNIPFNMTADILDILLSNQNPPKDVFLIIQKESALKYAGHPYGPERFKSLDFKPFFDLKIIYDFKKSDFKPVPQVDIVLLNIKRKDVPLVSEKEIRTYQDFIAYGFSQRRATLEERFGKIFTKEQFKHLSQDLKFKLDVAPTDLNFEQWLGLFKYFLVGVSAHKKMTVNGFSDRLKLQQKKLDKIHRTRVSKK